MGKNWKARARKHLKKKTGMRISGRSLLTIEDVKRKRAERIKNARTSKRVRSSTP